MIFGHYIRNFVRFNACFSAFWNLTGKANKTDLIQPLLPTTGLEGARARCAPRLDPPVNNVILRKATAVAMSIVGCILLNLYSSVTLTCRAAQHGAM